MKFEPQFFGYFAIGDVVYFRPISGQPVSVMQAPPDVDSHVIADALNDAGNSVLRIISISSEWKL